MSSLPLTESSEDLPITIVEHTGDPAPIAEVLLELRPQYEHADAIAKTLRELTRSQGLRVFGAHIGDDPIAAAAATVRLQTSLSQGRFLYVDDLVTRGNMRGRGLAGRLMGRVDELAVEAGIPGKVQLDSGVGDHRAAAHAFYGGRGMWIAGFHFMQRVKD
jgi:GNAT superfamily N-acetyltransferase